MTDALSQQVGGDHYKKGIQPFQLSLANRHDACIHAIQKYLTRHARLPANEGYLALQKAHHIVMIRVETIGEYGLPIAPEKTLIPIGAYILSNGLDPRTAAAVEAVENWHLEGSAASHSDHAVIVRKLIRWAATSTYPLTYEEKDFI